MTDRMDVYRTIKLEGPAVARQRFGDAIVVDLLTKGLGTTPTPTGDCACGGHHGPARPTYDHAALAGIAASLREAAEVAKGLAPAYAAHLGRRQAAVSADLRKGVNVPAGRFFDSAAAARGRAASNTAHAKQIGGAIPRMNANAAEFWAKQQAGGAR